MNHGKTGLLESQRLLGYIHRFIRYHLYRQNLGLHNASTLVRLIAISVALGGVAKSQTYGSDFHRATVRVNQFTVVQVSSASVSLTISGANAIAGQDLMTVADLSTTFLWGTNVSQRKVTAQTSLAAPIFTLKVFASSPTQGTASAETIISTTPQDFLINIGKSSGSCQIQYTGEALASQGTGSDAHTITFTVTVQ